MTAPVPYEEGCSMCTQSTPPIGPGGDYLTTQPLIQSYHSPLNVMVFCSAVTSSYLRQAACHCWRTRSLYTFNGCAAVSPTNRLLQYHSVMRRSLKYLQTRGTLSTRSLHGTQERMADNISAGRSKICIPHRDYNRATET